MGHLEQSAAVFCTACICAELISRLVGSGWGQKCIKAVAGLYILIVFLDVLSGVKTTFAALELPQAEAVSIGNLEDAVLVRTQEELSRTLEGACRQKTGADLKLEISLTQTTEGVNADEVRIFSQNEVEPDRKQAVESFLMQQLQLAPENIIWESPGGGNVS